MQYIHESFGISDINNYSGSRRYQMRKLMYYSDLL